MNIRSSLHVAIVAIGLLGRWPAHAQNAYITNEGDNTVSVIDTTSNVVTATIPVGSAPYGVAVTPDGSKVYVADMNSFGMVSVIDTATNLVSATISLGPFPPLRGSSEPGR